MPDLYGVMNAPTGKLDNAIARWSDAIAELERIEGDIKGQVSDPVLAAGWKGEGATAGLAFMRSVSRELEHAIAEATGIKKILSDANQSIKRAKRELTRIVEEEAPRKRLHVDSDGRVFKVNNYEGTGSQQEMERMQAEIDSMARRIRKLLTEAADADSDAAWALHANRGKGNYNFNAPDHRSLKEADKAHAIADGKEAVALARKGGDRLSGAELAHLNKLVSTNRNDPLFAGTFASDLGGKRSLEFWADVMNSHQGNIDRRDATTLRELQSNLGDTFATASYSDSPGMQRWKDDVIKNGNQQFITNRSTESTGPYGFQVMSSLLRHGKYEPKFLNKYGNALYDFEKNTEAPNLWANGGKLHNDLNFSNGGNNDDDGKDPMTGFLQALGRNPEASTKFFSDEEKFNYLTGVESEGGPEPRIWPLDNAHYVPNPDQSRRLPGFDSLGHALESATTGHPYDKPPSPDDAVHSRAQAQIMERLVASGSADPDSIHPGLSDSLGRISAEYMPDIHRALDHSGDSGKYLYPIKGSVADLSEADVTRFLHKVGQDPDGYAAVNLGQRHYTPALIEFHAEHPSLYVDGQDEEDRSTGYRNMTRSITSRAGEIEGIVGAGRTYALEKHIVESDGQFNDALSKGSAWATSIVGIGVGLGTSEMIGPGGIIIGGLAGIVTSDLIGGISESLSREGIADQIYKNGRDWESLKEHTSSVAQHSVAATQLGNAPQRGDYQTAAAEGVEEGFGYAQDNVNNYVHGHHG